MRTPLRTHPARRISTVWLLLSLAGAAGSGACGSDDSSTTQGQAGSGGGAADGGESRAGRGGGGATAQGEPQLGAACARDADCSGGYLCDQEMRMSVPVQGAPGGSIDQILFLGGSCTPKRLTAFNPANVGESCDPLEPVGAQGCGPDGVCDAVARSTAGFLVGCRKECDPVAQDTGCREGYECDFSDDYCSEGCQDDVECRVVPVDSDGDGTSDALAYDSMSTMTCDPGSARCVHPAGPQASGESCMRDEECTENGVCIVPDAVIAGQSFPGGQCTRRGCNYAGQECDAGTVCEPLRPWLGDSPTEPLCLQRCTVGAEAPELQVGSMGHGEGCREGYRCHYNGGAGVESGVCVGGNYNAVTDNNVGAECESDADCYSPFGLGYCLTYRISSSESLPGICTILDCAAPGMPADLCGEGNECVASGSSDETNCDHHCKTATDCPTSFACTDDDNDTATPRTCIPACRTDADCRSGEKCTPAAQSTAGTLSVCRLQ